MTARNNGPWDPRILVNELTIYHNLGEVNLVNINFYLRLLDFTDCLRLSINGPVLPKSYLNQTEYNTKVAYHFQLPRF